MGINDATIPWQRLKTAVIPEVMSLLLGRGEVVERTRIEGFASKLALFDPQAAGGLERWDLNANFGFKGLETKQANGNKFHVLN